MILQALYEHYQRLLEEPESGIAPPGYSPAKVSHAIVLDDDGDIVDIWNITDAKGKKSVSKVILVPEQVTRTSGISANILCDNASYVIGIESKQVNVGITNEKYDDFRNKNITFLSDVDGEEAKAVRNFLKKWEPEFAVSHPVIGSKLEEILQAKNIVFKLDGAMGYVHESPTIREAWINKFQDSPNEISQQCLITGENFPIARIHPMIKGIVGAQTSGASIVSFNVDSFTSYGKSQSYNAPVSQKAAFAYTTALNYLVASDTNHVRLADTTVVFWADKKGGKSEETVLAWSLDPVIPQMDDSDEKRRINPVAARQAKEILERFRSGLPIATAEFDINTRCYLLGLAPNAARLSVRFWQISSFGDILHRIAQHYKDMEIAGIERLGGIISPWRILKAIAIQEDTKNIPPLLGGQFLKTILSGQMYPHTLYNLAISRCRAGGDHGGVNTIRAAIIKAFLLRQFRLQSQKEKEGMITLSLSENNTNTGYQLGRLFSLLEKVQRDALGTQINATIRDRYFGAASATPGSVFPLLLRLSRHHISKAQYGDLIDRKIQEVVGRIDIFPAHLNMEDQGQFILGYYHQNQANYEKKDKEIKQSERQVDDDEHN